MKYYAAAGTAIREEIMLSYQMNSLQTAILFKSAKEKINRNDVYLSLFHNLWMVTLNKKKKKKEKEKKKTVNPDNLYLHIIGIF